MNEKEFLSLCRSEVVKYTNEHLDKSDKKELTENDVIVVWCVKKLQNYNALLITLFDDMHYEFTYNRDEKELYFATYKPWGKRVNSITCA